MMNRTQKLLGIVLMAVATTSAQAAEIPGVPAEKGAKCTFQEGVRYSAVVINARMNDFKANRNDAGFGIFNDNGQLVASPTTTKTTLDYVPGLVAKAILEAIDYYKDVPGVNVKPWWYAMQYYGCHYDIAFAGKQGMSFDDLNAVKMYFKLQDLAAKGTFADGQQYSNQQTLSTSAQRFAEALQGIKTANSTYIIKASTLAGAAGGWWHKANYVNQMWCDGQYMGPALLAQMINEYQGYQPVTGNDWDLLTRQFSIAWKYLWNDDTRLLYHAFTAEPGGFAAKDWAGILSTPGKEIYHSAEYWGRAVGWYFLALVDILEQMQQKALTTSDNYQTLLTQLQLLAEGLAARQDEATGCWYQLLAHDGNFKATTYNASYRYTDQPVNNYLESSCTAIFTAAYLKAVRLGLLDKKYVDIAQKAYKGMIEQFMVSDGEGGVHLVGCCKSAGLGGSNYRDGSAAYYLLGMDTEPTVGDPASPSFYTEGKVFGAFVLAATEYERLQDHPSGIKSVAMQKTADNKYYNLAGQQVTDLSKGLMIAYNKKTIR